MPHAYDDSTITYDSTKTYDGAGQSTFTPPSDQIVPPIYVTPDQFYPSPMNALFRHYENQWRGRNIFLMSDGTTRDSQINGTPPNMILPATDPYSRAIYESGGALIEVDTYQVPYVTAVMYGGTANPVTTAQAAQLVANGYVLDS